MAQATTTTTAAISRDFSVRLRRLRTRITAWFLVDGVSRLLLCVALVIVVDFLVDWLFHMDRSQRIVMLVLAAGVLVAVFYRRVIRPLSCRLTDDALCLEIENRNEELGESLISAVQLARMDDFQSRGVSPALAHATIDRGMQRAADLPFERILRSDRFTANLMLLILMSLVLAGVAVSTVVNDTMAIWFNRNVLLGDRDWPQDVHLVIQRVENGRLTVARGDDWPVIVTVRDDSRRLPKTVHMDFRDTSGRRSEQMEKLGQRRFQAIWRNVVEPFEFRARSKRATTPWVTVELVDRPRTDQLLLEATSPEYAGGATEPLPPGKGPYYVLKGSTLEVRGTANKRLSQAVLVAAGSRHEMTITDGRRFQTSLSSGKVEGGAYHVELADTERLTLPETGEPGPLRSKRPTSFTLKFKPDREPQVLAKLIGISTLVVPEARIPFDCRIQDDYGLSAARLCHQWRGEKDDSGSDGVDRLDELQGSGNSTALSFQSALELPPLEIPAGSRLTLSIEADDNDDVSGPKSGKSTTFVLRVVSADELRTDLLRREKEHRLQFEGHLKQQEDVATECEALLADVRGEPRMQAEQRQFLVKLGKRQKLLGTNMAALANRFEGIIAEVQNNRLEEENGPLQRRLRYRIVDPMWSLTDESIPDAAGHLDRAWRLSGEAAQRNEALSDAIAAKKAILASMREILNHLVKVEGFQEAVNLLYETQRAQKDVFELTDTERQKRIRQILDQGSPEK
jgi:hypothetical protein